jgi:hypothetical protein
VGDDYDPLIAAIFLHQGAGPVGTAVIHHIDAADFAADLLDDVQDVATDLIARDYYGDPRRINAGSEDQILGGDSGIHSTKL